MTRHLLRLTAVGHGTSGRLQVLAAGTEALVRRRLKRRLGVTSPRLVTLDVEGRPHRTAIREFTDLAVAHRILHERVYDVTLDPPPRTVLDLGSHIGLSALWLRSRFPEATLVAVEPDPRAFALLERNLGGAPRTHLLNVAVGSPGPRRLALADATVSSSLSDRPGNALTVEAMSIDDIKQRLSLERIDLLKIDVEGAEWEVLSAWDGIGEPEAIVGEFHPDALPVPLASLLELLDRYAIEKRGRPDPGHFEFVATQSGGAGMPVSASSVRQ